MEERISKLLSEKFRGFGSAIHVPFIVDHFQKLSHLLNEVQSKCSLLTHRSFQVDSW